MPAVVCGACDGTFELWSAAPGLRTHCPLCGAVVELGEVEVEVARVRRTGDAPLPRRHPPRLSRPQLVRLLLVCASLAAASVGVVLVLREPQPFLDLFERALRRGTAPTVVPPELAPPAPERR